MHSSARMLRQLGDCLLPRAGAAVLRMLRAWANRNNKQMPLPTFETTPGATPKQVRLQQLWAARRHAQAKALATHMSRQQSGGNPKMQRPKRPALSHR